ncbi:hypothetical protein KPK_0476 [Klebsiella variicola]|uniref:Uncharacterized protein n=1 Tax=Klebsiella variicola (strain 342) TaxID=507522 RepID=B5XSQ6_KLEV3|nr:hypothetical protein KPK_0476 [Klebsiella variicola]
MVFLLKYAPFITLLTYPVADYLHKNSRLCIMMLFLPP